MKKIKLETIKIEFKYTEITNKKKKDKYTCAAPVCCYDETEKSEVTWGDGKKYSVVLIDADTKVTDSTSIRIKFDYPLRNPVFFEFKNKDGFTKKELYKCIFEGYSTIYSEEESTEGTPEIKGFLLNRPSTNGKYGIWGHVIEDLIIECVHQLSPTEFTLGIGS